MDYSVKAHIWALPELKILRSLDPKTTQDDIEKKKKKILAP